MMHADPNTKNPGWALNQLAILGVPQEELIEMGRNRTGMMQERQKVEDKEKYNAAKMREWNKYIQEKRKEHIELHGAEPGPEFGQELVDDWDENFDNDWRRFHPDSQALPQVDPGAQPGAQPGAATRSRDHHPRKTKRHKTPCHHPRSFTAG